MKKVLEVPRIKQKNESSCGPTCLSMMFNYYGLNLDQFQIEDEITALYPKYKLKTIRKYGLCQKSLKGYVDEKGFRSYHIINSNLEELTELINQGIPPIIVLDYVNERVCGHYSVVIGYDLKKNLIYYNDPNDMRRTRLSLDFFLDLWSQKDSKCRCQDYKNEMIIIKPKC